ncbi:MAG: hypothetical protein R3C05_23820 [Pirellulaceae bacterium]
MTIVGTVLNNTASGGWVRTIKGRWYLQRWWCSGHLRGHLSSRQRCQWSIRQRRRVLKAAAGTLAGGGLGSVSIMNSTVSLNILNRAKWNQQTVAGTTAILSGVNLNQNNVGVAPAARQSRQRWRAACHGECNCDHQQGDREQQYRH